MDILAQTFHLLGRFGTFTFPFRHRRHFNRGHFGTTDISAHGHFGTADILAHGHFGTLDVLAHGHFGTVDILAHGRFGTADVSAWWTFRHISGREFFGVDVSARGHFGTVDISAQGFFGTGHFSMDFLGTFQVGNFLAWTIWHKNISARWIFWHKDFSALEISAHFRLGIVWQFSLWPNYSIFSIFALDCVPQIFHASSNLS
jgi:hypothetical protein